MKDVIVVYMQLFLLALLDKQIGTKNANAR